MAACGALTLGAAAPPQPGSDIAVYGTGAPGEPVDQRLARLRDAREAHRRKQIWTKDAHGGPYRKVRGLLARGRRADGRRAAGRCRTRR